MRLILLPLFLFLGLMPACMVSTAQVCSGGLGDPIVKFTFGSGTATYGGKLAAGLTNMTYVETQCPQGSDVGSYAIVHSPGNSCFTGDWLNFTGDHTGDPNGYFMLINASTPPSDFYTQTVSGLCPSTSYQFAAWIINMASHSGEIDPDITFNIESPDGTVLQTFQTGDVSMQNPAHWNQYAFYFTTPPGVSTVVIRMRNNAPGGYGNDLGLDDITFRASGPSVNIHMTGHAGDTASFCADPANTLGFTSTIAACYASIAYQWQGSSDNGTTWTDLPGAVNPTLTEFPTSVGNYLYRLTAAQSGNIGISSCQVASLPDSVVVLETVHPAISITLEAGHVCTDSIATFIPTPVDGGSNPLYQWMLNGTPVTTAPTYNSTLANGDQVSCLMTSNAVCAAYPTAPSNTITIHLLPDVVTSVNILSSANNICHDSLVSFTASPFNGGNDPSYQWLVNGQPVGSDTSAFSSRELNQGDQVSVLMTSDLSCTIPATSNAIDMTVYDVPRIQLTPDTIIAAHTQIILDPVVTGPADYHQWSPATDLDDPTLLQPTASPVTTIVYQLFVSSDKGCTATARERVEVFYDLFMPNAFTPNGDGRNDLYRIPPFITVTIRHFSIFDRWGKQVFSTNNSTEGWDGRFAGHPQPADTYVWYVEYTNPILKKTMMKKGTVELVR